jgi:hypothetical protein
LQQQAAKQDMEQQMHRYGTTDAQIWNNRCTHDAPFFFDDIRPLELDNSLPILFAALQWLL